MSNGSSQQFVSRNRPPIIHTLIEVETWDAEPVYELPFVMGVLGDYSGDSADQLPKKLSEREFREVDVDNFDEYMREQKPTVNFRVKNKLSSEGEELKGTLTFDTLDSFRPENVAKQVPALKELLDKRTELKDLLATMDVRDKLEPLVAALAGDPALMKGLQDFIASKHGGGATEAPAEPEASKPEETPSEEPPSEES